MGMFDIGCRPNLHFSNEEIAATIIYNDGNIAIAGTAYSPELCEIYDDVCYENEFLMAKEQIQCIIPEIEDYNGYNSFIIVDLHAGCLIEYDDWKQRNNITEIPEEIISTQENNG